MFQLSTPPDPAFFFYRPLRGKKLVSYPKVQSPSFQVLARGLSPRTLRGILVAGQSGSIQCCVLAVGR